MRWRRSHAILEPDMAEATSDISKKYLAALRDYLAQQQEATLQRAHEMARQAMAQGLGVLEMARIHQEALSTIPPASARPETNPWASEAAETFFLETLSPFEATHRGFSETNVKLRHLIETLEERNETLARINRELETEIADRKLAEEKLTKTGMMLSEAQRLAHMGSWEWDISKDFFCWSDELYRIYALDPREFAGTYQAFIERVHPDDRKRVSASIATALRDARPFTFHHRIIRPDETVRILCARGQVVTDTQGKPVRMFGTGQDVTEFKKAEEALQVSESRLQSILDYSPAVIFLKDTQGHYLHVNRQFERLFELPRSQIVGKQDDEIFPPDQAAAFAANDRKVLKAGVPIVFEEVATYSDGIHTSIVSKFPLRDASGKVYAICGIATDITERKLAEEALRQSKEHYQQLFNEARLMQDNLRDLSTRIFHVQEQERTRISRELHDEVGQALTAINVSLAVLQREPKLKSELIRQRIVDAQNLLEQTMETVHRFARELRPSMLDHLGLLPALRSYAKTFVERTRIDVRFRGSPEAEKLDSERKTVLYRVAQESLTNVAKHARASKVAISLRKLKGQIRLEIQDNGCSFDVSLLNGNKRLGLLGMRERVRLVNGRFAINSESGKGTTVRVEIPFKEQIMTKPETPNTLAEP